MAQDYTKSLNLPSTDFAMRANLPQREPGIYQKWQDIDLYHELMKKNDGKPSFILHDGPPYANGNIHTGHSLNKILKDFVVKYKNMNGFKTPFIHGWDTHGLPIENQMIKKHNIKRNETEPAKFRELCAKFAYENVETQMKQMQRLGVIGDWDNSYLTLKPSFEAKQIKIFGEMAKKGYIYKGMRPVYWCPSDETALADAEIEHSDDNCDSIYVKFALKDDHNIIKNAIGTTENVYFVIWTTTTWTLPGNLAICLGPDFEYSIVKNNDNCEYYIIATELIPSVSKAAKFNNMEIVAKFKGSEFEGMLAHHPFYERSSHVILGDHVTLDSGTGCVHTAPGHGIEDFEVCKNYDFIEVIVPVDAKGRLNELSGKYAGLKTEEANKVILEDLKESGALLAIEQIIHPYPHCWRCKSPVIFRATEQWFCSVENFKKAALDAIKDVKWIPSWGEVRIENMVRDRDDWCISRQRLWGVPIPIFYCETCGEPLINETTIERISDIFGREGSDAWYKKSVAEIIGDAAICKKCGHTEFRKEQDIMDVWFDSGSSYAFVLDEMEDHHFPADLYLEGNDQYRGWFQSSLLTSVAIRGVAPYKTVVTHGMVVDSEGKKMSKSIGNGIEPIDIIKEYGADILRLWVSSVDYMNDVRISKDILKQLSEIYRKIRNTSRIILANLGTAETDFNPNTDMVSIDDLYEIDKWAVSRINTLTKNILQSYESYEFHDIYHEIHTFCTIDMSKLYIDITKDRVYVENKNSKARRSAQTAMYIILNSLTRLMAPILAYTSEEIWQNIAHPDKDNKLSVILNPMPQYDEKLNFDEIETKWNKLFDLRDDVMKALEIARASKLIGKSLDAKVKIYAKDDETYQILNSFESELSTIFIVSQAELYDTEPPKEAYSETVSGIGVEVLLADGEKCDRCWIYTNDGEKTVEGYICSRCKSIIGE